MQAQAAEYDQKPLRLTMGRQLQAQQRRMETEKEYRHPPAGKISHFPGKIVYFKSEFLFRCDFLRLHNLAKKFQTSSDLFIKSAQLAGYDEIMHHVALTYLLFGQMQKCVDFCKSVSHFLRFLSTKNVSDRQDSQVPTRFPDEVH